MSERIDFRWRYQPRNELDAQLMQYIQNNHFMSKNEMVLLALRSFWLPHALAVDYPSEGIKRRTALSAVQTLKKQVKDILELAGLEEAFPEVRMQLTTEVNSSHIVSTTAATPHKSAPSGDAFGNTAEENAYDDTGLSNFL